MDLTQHVKAVQDKIAAALKAGEFRVGQIGQVQNTGSRNNEFRAIKTAARFRL